MVIQDEAALRDGAPQLADQAQPLGGVGVHSGLVAQIALTRLLRARERGLRVLQQRVRVGRVVRALRETRANRHAQLALMDA